MYLTDHTDYSLRVLMYLNEKKTLATLNELSEELQISKNNLIKVSNQLAKAQFITTTRGRAGGLKIHKNMGKKNLKEIIIETEKRFDMAACFTSDKSCACSFMKNCKLQKTLNEALNSFLDSLASKTLNDLTN